MRVSTLMSSAAAGALLLAAVVPASADSKVETLVFTSYAAPPPQVFQSIRVERASYIPVTTIWCDCCGGLVSTTQVVQIGRDVTYSSTFSVTNVTQK